MTVIQLNETKTVAKYDAQKLVNSVLSKLCEA